VAQIQNNLADLGNADSGEKALDCANFRLKSHIFIAGSA
jgi:hypothetical protein